MLEGSICATSVPYAVTGRRDGDRSSDRGDGSGRRDRRSRGRRGDGGSLTGAALQLVDPGITGDQTLTELLVLLTETAQFDDDLVEEVVDLILVVSLAELRRVEPLVDYSSGVSAMAATSLLPVSVGLVCAYASKNRVPVQECGRH